MADERGLRDALDGHRNDPTPTIDVGSVVRRARGRRRVRKFAAGAGVVASAAAVVTAVVVTLPPQATVTSGGAESGAADGAPGTGAPDSAEESTDSFSTTDLAPAYKVNGCEGAVALPVAVDGLTVDVEFPADAPVGTPLAGVVVLTNDGVAAVRGTASAPPATTLGEEGIVRWHSSDLGAVAVIDLAPGASVRLDATVQPVRCTADDEALPSLPDDLPAVPAGEYTVSAALDVTLSDGRVVQLVSAPEPVTLR
ncbi:hypothetical protein CLV46_2325 [Diaminobutyricimonas aerilata]|uniref:Uncharacterized protein n=1 Tax=Diaminobutyricimonas aerilata TaxID=1162967 RepID=A0A2M9CLK2_9MICO|nr:hypothetical protein [Diaminobutyricimonas aerilata]PJJ72749.1 hypothetical protein CLV46_2325 [Diaminobutyricimonas aerilata]